MHEGPGPSSGRLTSVALARTAEVDPSFVDELNRLGIIERDEEGYPRTAVYRVRYAALVLRAGIPLETVARARADGVVRFGDLDVLFPDPPMSAGLSHRELAERLDLSVETLLHVRLAAGLTACDPDDPLRSDDEVVLRLIVDMARVYGDVELAPRVARMFGDRTRATIAAAIELFREHIDRPWLQAGGVLDSDTIESGITSGRHLMDDSEALLVALARRHTEGGILAGWVETTESLLGTHGYLDERPVPAPGVAFVDISGYTALTHDQGDDVATALATRLLTAAEHAAAYNETRIVKLLGDGVMLTSADPRQLFDAVLELVEGFGVGDVPPAHAGVHAGPVVEWDGDILGNTVNVAARIAGTAGPGEILVSEAAAAFAGPAHHLEALPPSQLRGVREALALHRLRRAGRS